METLPSKTKIIITMISSFVALFLFSVFATEKMFVVLLGITVFLNCALVGLLTLTFYAISRSLE